MKRGLMFHITSPIFSGLEEDFFVFLCLFLTFTGTSVRPEGESCRAGAMWPSAHWGALLLAGAVSWRQYMAAWGQTWSTVKSSPHTRGERALWRQNALSTAVAIRSFPPFFPGWSLTWVILCFLHVGPPPWCHRNGTRETKAWPCDTIALCLTFTAQ